MQVISFEQARQRLDTLCEQAYQDHQTYVLHREDNHDVVILSLADYHARQETYHCLANLHHAQHLLTAVRSTPGEGTSWPTDQLSTTPASPKFGSAKGLIEMTADFDEPLEEFQDPFDRVLVAQSLVENLPLLSRDELLSSYGVKRLWKPD